MTAKRTIVTLMLVMLMLGICAPASAASLDGYNYSYWGEAVPAPDPYRAAEVIYGPDLNIGPMVSPQDMYISSTGAIYIADTGNSRVIVLDKKLGVERVITEFDHAGKKDTFNQPEGVFADAKGHLFVADTQNRRIIELSADGEFVREINEPKSSLIREGFQFTPIKLVVDKAERLYLISRGSYEGIMEFDSDGVFSGFIGTNRVKFSPMDLFWKRISTKKQRDQMEQFIPLEFNNIAIDDDGFMYTTTVEENSDSPIKKLNPSGVDILRSKGYFPPKGDIGTMEVGSFPGSSIFVDVTQDAGGMYSALDSKRGRIFSYDKDGNLLYMFGGLGAEQGKFRTPSAIGLQGDRVIVLDKDNNRLTVFEPTRYGQLIRDAVTSLYNGKVEQSTTAWKQVLKLNSNFEVAYIGIGKSLLKQGDNKEAMTYFELGNNRENYSEAFKRYRKEIVMDRFGTIVLSLAAAIGIIYAMIKLMRRRAASGYYKEVGPLKNPFYTMLHPFNGFWEMKFEKQGRVKIAAFILFLLVLLTIVKRQYSGFVVNFNNPAELNSINELKYIILPFLLWCVANWSLTTLMDGEGKFKEIVMATGYSLLPFVIIYLPQTLYSRFITADESSFYYLLDTVAIVWFIALLFVGTMTIHQYSAGKTVLTMLLTLVVIGIMLFLGVLFFSMLQQMISFMMSLYHELSFRVR
ncbi:YIP1 family protein [Paenibacillus sp. CF384]|uniref:YIP1 family protein n=1 Tax=Paenibacillus sp. CF384 TaxID=1884382 RepID=UPI00089D56B1|nr:YIP1 family protein [Paenibacillus sp. CF384]SDW56341.1 Yip1 domain-containing protein [Paenibacillus sp. CF384]